MVRRSSSAWEGCSSHAVAGIEHGQAGCVREQIRRAGIRAAQDDAFGAEGLEGDAGVLEGFALFDAGGKGADQGSVGAEGFRGQFERGAGARARFVEEQGDAALLQPMGALHGIFFFERVGGFQNSANFGDREVAGGDGRAGMDGRLGKMRGWRLLWFADCGPGQRHLLKTAGSLWPVACSWRNPVRASAVVPSYTRSTSKTCSSLSTSFSLTSIISRCEVGTARPTNVASMGSSR